MSNLLLIYLASVLLPLFFCLLKDKKKFIWIGRIHSLLMALFSYLLFLELMSIHLESDFFNFSRNFYIYTSLYYGYRTFSFSSRHLEDGRKMSFQKVFFLEIIFIYLLVVKSFLAMLLAFSLIRFLATGRNLGRLNTYSGFIILFLFSIFIPSGADMKEVASLELNNFFYVLLLLYMVDLVSFKHFWRLLRKNPATEVFAPIFQVSHFFILTKLIPKLLSSPVLINILIFVLFTHLLIVGFNSLVSSKKGENIQLVASSYFYIGAINFCLGHEGLGNLFCLNYFLINTLIVLEETYSWKQSLLCRKFYRLMIYLLILPSVGGPLFWGMHDLFILNIFGPQPDFLAWALVPWALISSVAVLRTQEFRLTEIISYLKRSRKKEKILSSFVFLLLFSFPMIIFLTGGEIKSEGLNFNELRANEILETTSQAMVGMIYLVLFLLGVLAITGSFYFKQSINNFLKTFVIKNHRLVASMSNSYFKFDNTTYVFSGLNKIFLFLKIINERILKPSKNYGLYYFRTSSFLYSKFYKSTAWETIDLVIFFFAVSFIYFFLLVQETL